MAKRYMLKFRAVDKDSFSFVKNGSKKIETRASTEKYAPIRKGDEIVFSCGREKFSKKVVKVEKFRSIGAIYRKYKPHQINPTWKTQQDGRRAWASFPNYTEKIKKYGLVALTLK